MRWDISLSIRESDKKEQTVSEHSLTTLQKSQVNLGKLFGDATTLLGYRESYMMLENFATILQNTFMGKVMHKEAKLTIVIWEQNIFLLYHKSCAKRMPFLWMLLF